MKNVIMTLLFVLGVGYILYDTGRARSQNDERIVSFRSSWNTSLTGEIFKIEVISNDAGILHILIDSLAGNNNSIENYSKGPFYLLTKEGIAKIMEGGLSQLAVGDYIEINRDGDVAFFRNGRLVDSRRVYLRDFQPFWDMVDLEKVKKKW